MARPIVFLSDFGLEDEFVGVCHAVIARISPQTGVIDLTHGVPRQDVVRGAILLADTAPYMPDDAVFLAVVDPGVGTERREMAAATSSGTLMVGPDNGVLSLAWERQGGLTRAVHITASGVTLEPRSSTFHGRDVFAPAAAHLSAGASLDDLGPPIDLDSLVRIRLAEPVIGPGSIHAEVLDIDRFGNIELNVRERHTGEAGLRGSAELLVVTGEPNPRSASAQWSDTFGGLQEGALGAMFDSRGWLAIVMSGESAAELLGVSPGDAVLLQSPGAVSSPADSSVPA